MQAGATDDDPPGVCSLDGGQRALSRLKRHMDRPAYPTWSLTDEAELSSGNLGHLADRWMREAVLIMETADSDLSSMMDESDEVTPDERLNDLIREQPHLAWSLILDVIRRADDRLLPFIAAGPLEDFLRAHALEYITQVEDVAGRDQRFQKALRSVWGWTSIPPDIQLRLSAAAGRTA